MKELYEETEMKNRIIFLQYNTQKGQKLYTQRPVRWE